MKTATPDKPAIISGNNGNPYHECGEWLVQRRPDGRWLGYRNCYFEEDFAYSETAALAWLKSKI